MAPVAIMATSPKIMDNIPKFDLLTRQKCDCVIVIICGPTQKAVRMPLDSLSKIRVADTVNAQKNTIYSFLPDPLSAKAPATEGQIWVLGAVALLILAALFGQIKIIQDGLYATLALLFLINSVFRVWAAFSQKNVESTKRLAAHSWPTYSVIVALYKEASVLPQLIVALLKLNYDTSKLEILLTFEEDDFQTLGIIKKYKLPSYFRILTVPHGTLKTKPRALNYALMQAKGELCVIYDAEDRPHPDQLKVAARRFSEADKSLICLQSPLDVVGGKSLLARHFALEYELHFRAFLPHLARLGLALPLGGTSNHFRTEALKTLGAWDPYNVTEDADLGLRMAAAGYRTEMLSLATLESAPESLKVWLPQRTRWIKGHLQTLLVHTRTKTILQPKAFANVFWGLGAGLLSSFFFLPASLMILVSFTINALQIMQFGLKAAAPLPIFDTTIWTLGTIGQLLAIARAKRQGRKDIRYCDVFSLPLYWALQSLAAYFALYQLLTKPFHWDKTEHKPALELA